MSIEDVPGTPQMGQCDITGKIVPEDELVTIQGQRVCAEGKAILLERLKSGEGLPGEKERPTVLRRFGCMFLDGLIIGVPVAIVQGIVATTGSIAAAGAVAAGASVLQMIYFAQMHASKGQTVGKMAGKIIVVNLDGSPISTQTAYVRALAYQWPNFLSAASIFIEVEAFVIMTGLVSGIWGLANILFALIDTAQQRALHDRIAGTRVVMKD